MKKLLNFIFIILIFCDIHATDTIIYQSTVTLNSDFSAYDDVEVVATNGINLGAGFAYSSDGSGVFSAIGNPYVFDVPSGSSSSTGGDSVSTSDQDLDYNLVVGSVNGDAGVSKRGAATYNIPITVPKGTNGMGPQLSISYNSQVSASGVLGRSWNLNGVSSITTTGSNYYYDGKKGAISHSDSLSFLMWDGQRLFGINAKGLEADSFKTENKSYCRIEKKSGGNGDYFEIKTPDGNTLIYGQAFSAQMHFNDTTEWMWLLETVEGRNGNEISYTYSKDASKNRILLTKIEYGGSSLNPINEIEFHYSEKARISYAYILNNLVVSDQQLDSISMKSNGTFIGAFTMDYQISGTEMLLCEINQYDKDNNRYNPTKVNWETPSISVVPTSVNTPVESGANFIYYSGDYNGDGFSDLISLKLDYVSNKYVYYLYEGSTAGLPSTPSDTGALPRSYTHQFWDDMNTYATDNCSGSYDSEFEICDIVNLASGDFDGDGLDELMIKTMEWNAFAPYLPEDLNSVFTW